jgi:hypothetical protein
LRCDFSLRPSRRFLEPPGESSHTVENKIADQPFSQNIG